MKVIKHKSKFPYQIKLKIAEIIIRMQSKFKIEELTEDEEIRHVAERYNNFLYKG